MRLAIILLLSLFGCAPSGPHAYQGQQAVYVYLSPLEWNTHERFQIRAEFEVLEAAYGVHFETSDQTSANVTIRRDDMPHVSTGSRAAYGAEEIYINTKALSTWTYNTQLQSIAAHELGHWLGMQHLPEPYRGVMSQIAVTNVPTTQDIAQFNRQVRDVWATHLVQ